MRLFVSSRTAAWLVRAIERLEVKGIVVVSDFSGGQRAKLYQQAFDCTGFKITPDGPKHGPVRKGRGGKVKRW